jgi:hypothetical protein
MNDQNLSLQNKINIMIFFARDWNIVFLVIELCFAKGIITKHILDQKLTLSYSWITSIHAYYLL